MQFTPRPYQKLIIDFMLKNLRCNIFAGMGMGKTSASLYAFDAMRMFNEAKRGLIIAPKRVARSTWPNEIDKWDDFGHLKIVAAIGTESQRIAALRQNADLVAINYDNLPWLVEIMGDAWHFDTVFADESTRLKALRITMEKARKKDGSEGKEYIKGQGSIRAKALAEVAHRKVRRWVNMTGSPAPNGLQDLWGQQWFVDAGRALGTSFSAYEERFFQKIGNDNGYGARTVPLASSAALIQDLMRRNSITVDPRDWFNIKDPIETEIAIDLPPKARRIYDEFEKELFAEIEAGVVINAFNEGSKLQKCMQLANGAVYTNTETRAWEEVHDEKIEALKSVVEEANGESILIRYTHIPDKLRILKAFPKARFLDDNPQTEKDWNQGRIPLLVTHARSAGHGLSLQDGGRILCDFSTDFNLEEDEQIIERVGPTRQAQSGYDRAVYRYRLIARDTVEQLCCLPVVRRKATAQEAFKSAMKLRKGA